MFEKLKQLQELKKLQDNFKKETATIENNGIAVTMNGNFEVIEVKLNPDISLEEQQNIVKACFNKAREDIQKKLAQQMMSSGFSI